MKRLLPTLGPLLLAACGSFQSEDIVVDLRVLAMTASVPEQVVDVSLDNPPKPEEILAQLVPSEVCALVADPNFDRRLRYSLTLCLSDGGRCTGGPMVELASGLLADPDLTPLEPRLCATVMPDTNLLAIMLEYLKEDILHGLGGIDYNVGLRVGGEDVDPELDLYAGKLLRVSPRIPAARTPNHNPTIDHFEIQAGDADPVTLPLGRCVEQTAPLEVQAGQTLRLDPIETPDAREMYVVPTLDGGMEMFTESLTYQWMSGAGSFSSGSTGGPRNRVTGDPAPLFTDYKSPHGDDIPASMLVPLWIVQRDERFGATWYESCLRIAP